MSDILNPADEENLLTPEDEHGGSKDEIQNGQKSPSTSLVKFHQRRTETLY